MAVATAACGDGGPARDSDGNIISASEISVFDLEQGDCFQDPDAAAVEVQRVRVVPCAESHDNEIYLAFDLADGAFPGAAEMDEEVDGRCFAAFEPFVGFDYFESVLDFFAVTPTADSWENGDRTVYCALYSVDFSQLTGTMRSSGR